MDDFPGLLSGEFGLRPQGKSAPMAASRGGSIPGRSSDSMPMPSFSSSASSNARSNRESSLLGDLMPMDPIVGGNSKQDYGGGGLGVLDGIFLGEGSGSVNRRNSAAATSSASLGLDSVFDGFQDPIVKMTHSGPIFDKPVYDDDMFGGIPGLKTTSTGKFDDVFASLSSASTHQRMPVQDDDILRDLSGKDQRESVSGRKQSENTSRHMPVVDDDILGDLSGKDHRSSVSERKQSADDMDRSMHSFEDLIPGFGSSSPLKRDYSHAKHQGSSSQSNKAETSVLDDPFVDLNSKSVPSQPSSGFVMNPLDNIRVPSGKKKSDISSGLFDDGNIFNGSNKVMPPFSSEVNDIQKYKNSLKTAQETNRRHPHIAKESFGSSVNNISDTSSEKVSTGSSREPAKAQFDIPSGHLETGTNSGRFGFPSADSNLEKPENEHSHDVEEIWLTVSEVPLFTQPTNAPPPSRPPPPFKKGQNPFAYGDKGAYSNAKSKGNPAYFFQQRTQSNVSSEPFCDSPKTFGVSSVDELEDFAMGRRQAYAYEHTETVSSEEDNETNSASAAAAAATAAALDNAEAKMKEAKELRERMESRNFKNMDFPHQVKKDKAMADFQSQESKEKSDDFDHEQELWEREEKEKERRKLERKRERAAVEKTLQEVRERAAAEARERAAAEARQKAERAAVGKANAEARERAARASVQKATAEARERAAAEARERAAAEAKEKLAREREVKEREAREKAAAIQREREAKEREAREKASAIQRERERAAVQRATQDARLRAGRAAVEKANREARERAAAAAREKLQKSENDLDSVFGMGSRATSEPKQRASAPDVSFDTQVQNKGDSGGMRTMPSASSSGMRKTSSANFLDDLNSVFGAPPPSGEFQEIDGESEERQRARLERHQRTRERAAKALAEKNQRDMQVQMEQAERDRITERLEIEIKRWAAGKQGNLRALLSTLQYVLWPECGWQAVSLTDLITSASVKKVYRKATLHIHPDKVQQKGANLEQKIIAEKVFDLLKESWNKFNSEELF